MPQKTYIHKPQQANAGRKHHLLDAKGKVLGRLSTMAATLLRGKHKPIYTDSVDCGDFIDIINAKGIVLTGHKWEQKFYFSHSGWAGGAKTTPVARLFEKQPGKVVYLAIKRMIPANRLRGKQLARLKIYPGNKNEK